MNLVDKATIIHFHRHRIATYANGTVKALGWKGMALPRVDCVLASGAFGYRSVEGA